MRLAYSPDYRLIAIGIHNRLHLIDGVSGRSIKHFMPPDNPYQTGRGATLITGVGFNPSGDTVLVGTFDGSILAYRTSDWTLRAAFCWQLGFGRAFAISADGSTAITGDDNGIVKLWPIDRLLASLGDGS
jgi:WD40 repeat protein